VRVERGDHAGNGFGQQLLVIDLFDVIRLDETEHIGHLAQLLQGSDAVAFFCAMASN
jgi:hypothetical protein